MKDGSDMGGLKPTIYPPKTTCYATKDINKRSFKIFCPKRFSGSACKCHVYDMYSLAYQCWRA